MPQSKSFPVVSRDLQGIFHHNNQRPIPVGFHGFRFTLTSGAYSLSLVSEAGQEAVVPSASGENSSPRISTEVKSLEEPGWSFITGKGRATRHSKVRRVEKPAPWETPRDTRESRTHSRGPDGSPAPLPHLHLTPLQPALSKPLRPPPLRAGSRPNWVGLRDLPRGHLVPRRQPKLRGHAPQGALRPMRVTPRPLGPAPAAAGY